MKIGELSSRAGVSSRTLRYYEEQGLLEPARLPNGYRSYSDQDVEQVRRIRFLLAAGINTDMAREVLPCMVDDGSFLVPACEDLVAEFEREEAHIAERIAELDAVRTALAGIITAARSSSTRNAPK
ncbi:MerR family transcriptional regulator [Nesterenkonia ebinurensis]|uniref:MerR family transcriptional regulator n=1 Tax=Nesterenkonia ebinurensis TaxID=2608252 RepID=UPI00123D3CD1|nr:MerR family transcriptional regulator [Nesterenkonia ebinurensis]